MDNAQPFDLTRTFILINDGPTAEAVAVGPDFWDRIRQSPIANSAAGRLISLTEHSADWGRWEMHPACDEILFMLTGSLELVVEVDGAEKTIPLESLNAYIVPAGTWHRARVRTPGKMLAITGGAGTQHKPIATAPA